MYMWFHAQLTQKFLNGTISNDAYILWKIYHCDIVINYFSCGSKQIRPLIGTVRYLINEQDRFVFNFIISNQHALKFYECTRKSCRLGSRIRDVEAFW